MPPLRSLRPPSTFKLSSGGCVLKPPVFLVLFWGSHLFFFIPVCTANPPVLSCPISVGGQTIHSLCKIQIPQRVKDLGSMWQLTKETWRNMDVLVLDEVGMLSADLLDWIDNEVRSIRGKDLDKAFGGIQLIFVGDFAQLGVCVQ